MTGESDLVLGCTREVQMLTDLFAPCHRASEADARAPGSGGRAARAARAERAAAAHREPARAGARRDEAHVQPVAARHRTGAPRPAAAQQGQGEQIGGGGEGRRWKGRRWLHLCGHNNWATQRGFFWRSSVGRTNVTNR